MEDPKWSEKAICPHCGHQHLDMLAVDFSPGIEGDAVMECHSCSKPFMASKHAIVRYSTHLIEPKDHKAREAVEVMKGERSVMPARFERIANQ